MKEQDKELLKTEISKYIQQENYDKNGVKSVSIRMVSDVIAEFKDKRQGIRLLLDNSYGLLGNLLFKYVRDPDPEINRQIQETETKLIGDAYKKYGTRFVDKVRTWQVLKLLLKTDPAIIERFDWFLVDPDLAYEIAEYCPGIMKNVVARIKIDREFTRRMININPACLENAAWCYKADREIAYEAVSKDPEMLRFTDATLRNDKEIVMMAVSHRGLLLSYADESLKDDRDIIRTAVTNNGLAIRFASERLQNDEEIIKLAEESRRRMGWHQ